MELFEEFIDKLSNKEPFCFSRWGDGEFCSLLEMSDESKTNTDGHIYFKDMGEALANVLKKKPKYYLGVQRFARDERYPEEIDSFLNKYNLRDLNWVNADIFHHASIKGYFEKFFEVLTKRDDPVILVGPKYLENLGKFYNLHIEIPEKNCWLEKDKILDRVTRLLFANKNVVVLFVASMPANWLIDQLYNGFGDKHTFIDCGSVFDPYCGITKRGYHKKIIERLNKQK